VYPWGGVRASALVGKELQSCILPDGGLDPAVLGKETQEDRPARAGESRAVRGGRGRDESGGTSAYNAGAWLWSMNVLKQGILCWSTNQILWVLSYV
jgi:hypothetical protein